ncbi:uncharacterized protein [Pyrus communis]|uniref:uncharacterized protein n=1 Tax=Pyrus communis TaxID=23211 RepID=UPI0035BF4373
MGFVDVSNPCPVQHTSQSSDFSINSTDSYSFVESDAFVVWKMHDLAIMRLITATLSSVAMSCAIGSSSSKDLWIRLKEQFSTKKKGIQGIIEIENPNLVKPKTMKAQDVDMGTTTELSRREREELEKQRARERYMRLLEQGKTEQARKDLERLALIREQRAEAAKIEKKKKLGL